MALELPALPYDYEALQPYMSKETLEFHHDKHHQAYVTNGNKLLEGTGLADKSLEEIVQTAYKENMAGLLNNASQHWNHLRLQMMKKMAAVRSPARLKRRLSKILVLSPIFRLPLSRPVLHSSVLAGAGLPWAAMASSRSPKPRTAKALWLMEKLFFLAAMSGSIPIISITATAVPIM